MLNQPVPVADTILAQMGGFHRINAMVGVKYARQVTIDNCPGVTFAWRARAKDSINTCTITLAPTDTYTVTFSRSRTLAGVPTTKAVATYNDVYNSSLKNLFECVTELYLSL